MKKNEQAQYPSESCIYRQTVAVQWEDGLTTANGEVGRIPSQELQHKSP